MAGNQRRRDCSTRASAQLDPAPALARARQLDAGAVTGPLHGLPLGVKDLFDTADLPTAYGSAIWHGHRPRVDAGVVAACRAAGALIPGKTVTTEFAAFTAGPTRDLSTPVVMSDGSVYGTLCCISHEPRAAFGSRQLDSLRYVAQILRCFD